MKHIVVISCGTTPQIVTETLWALKVQKNIDWADCYVITTSTGEKILYSPSFLTHWRKLNQTLGSTPSRGLMQPNILTITDELNWIAYGNIVLSLLARLTCDPDTVVHVSLAGGRKPMSVLLAFGIALFGRECDQLYYVLANDEFSASGAFYPDEPASSAITVTDIPYIRLRPFLDKYIQTEPEQLSYSMLVALTQDRLYASLAPRCAELDLRSRYLCIDGTKIHLSLRELAVYWWIATAEQPIPWGKRLPDNEWIRFLNLYDRLCTYHRYRCKKFARTRNSIDEQIDILGKAISMIKQKIREKFSDSIAAQFFPLACGKYGDKSLSILAQITIGELPTCP